MYRRIISLFLTVVLLVSVTAPGITVKAVSTSAYTPYAKIQYEYAPNVKCGTIRYIAQNRESAYFSWNYWPTTSFGKYAKPEKECGTACISMALSYVGVDRTPKVLLETTDGVTGRMWGQQGDATSRSISLSTSAFSDAMNDYINGNGKYSPICLYIAPFSATSEMHWVLLMGKISENKYLALNPWHTAGTDATLVVQINGTTATYNGTTNPISSANQWYNPNANICAHTSYDSLGFCTSCGMEFDWRATYSGGSAGIYRVIKDFTPRQDRPYEAANGIGWELQQGSRVEVVGEYRNAFGNRWYGFLIDGQQHYVYESYLEYASVAPLRVQCSGFSPQNGAVLEKKSQPVLGTVTSNYPLFGIYAFLDNQLYAQWNPTDETTTQVDLRGTDINYGLAFGSLADGKHTITLYACSFVHEESVLFHSSVFYINSAGNNATVTFDANGGSCAESSRAVAIGSAIGALPEASKPGYVFAGWYPMAYTGEDPISAQTTVSQNVTYYAHYANRMYSGNRITFDMNGGYLPGCYASYTYSGINTFRNQTELEIYNCGGHAVRTSCYGDEVVVAADGRVTDRRGYLEEKILTVPEGGFVLSGHGDAGVFVSQIPIGDYVGYDTATGMVYVYSSRESYLAQHKYVSEGAAYGQLPVPSHDTMTFAGWYTDRTWSTEITAGSNLTATTLVAQWTGGLHTICYDANGGNGAPAAQLGQSGTEITLSSTIPTRFGYNFVGWTPIAGDVNAYYHPGETIQLDSDMTLYAVWRTDQIDTPAVECHAMIDYPGTGWYYRFVTPEDAYYRLYSIGTRDSRVYVYDASGNLIARDDDSAGNRQFLLDYYFSANTTYFVYVDYYSESVTGGIPFYVLRGYNVSYNANGGEGAPEAFIKYRNVEAALSTAVPTREGYTFQGWATSASGTAAYQPGDSITVYADTTLYAVWQPNLPQTDAQIVVSNGTASPGGTVTVTIAVKNNPGIASMKLKVAYGDILTLTNISYNTAIGGQFQQPQTMNSPVTLNWFNGAADSTGDWVFATLTFQISDAAQGGDVADITVRYDANDVYNIADQNVTFGIVNGQVTVASHTPGDITGDGAVNNRDLTRLFQYLSDWDVEVNEAALDVNGDGTVNNRDLTRLFQYLSDWDVEIY